MVWAKATLKAILEAVAERQAAKKVAAAEAESLGAKGAGSSGASKAEGELIVSNTQSSSTPLQLVQDAPGQPKRVADIELGHILDGEVKPIYSGGDIVGQRAVGGHYLRSPNVRVTEVIGEADASGVIKARYSGVTEMGDYFRHLVPTVMAGVADFPEALRRGIVVSDSADFGSDRIFRNSDISGVFTRMYR